LRDLEDIPAGISHVLVLDRGQVFRSGERQRVLDAPEVSALMSPPPLQPGKLPEPARRPYRLTPGIPLLELRNVSVRYGELAVLNSVNWVFRPGQHCNIAGPNGCGKTTLLSLITGENHKAYGQDITLFGQRRGSGESVWEIRQKFGKVDTQLHLNHARGMKVIEVVVSGFFDTVGLYDDWGGKQVEIARQWLNALDLGELAATPFDTLSFGLQRMVLLARAMVKSPAILILDEPCLGLDAYHTRTILDAVDHIAANSDTQIIFVSHSVGQMPGCINQWLEFIPEGRDFRLDCREAAGDH
jgi:molybdate transport system ATP-binding protein